MDQATQALPHALVLTMVQVVMGVVQLVATPHGQVNTMGVVCHVEAQFLGQRDGFPSLLNVLQES